MSGRQGKHQKRREIDGQGNVEFIKKEIEAEMLIDLDKLREISKYGVPAILRQRVWKFLLLVDSEDKSEQLTMTQGRMENFAAYMRVTYPCNDNLLSKLWEMYCATTKKEENRRRMRTVLLVFCRTHHGLISSTVSEDTADIWCFCVARFLDTIVDVMNQSRPINVHEMSDVHSVFAAFTERYFRLPFNTIVRPQVAYLTMLFRYLQPALSLSFESEEIYPNEWALGWVGSLLAGYLPEKNVARLWDLYLAEDMQLHVPDVWPPLTRHTCTHLHTGAAARLPARVHLPRCSSSSLRKADGA